ncbi:DUF6612 family protein [Sutcliffiella horikoshii]|uniref:DUF6612 family protein n=1 Tax=Sutcliffiella horikoshii TaxID=79883 RepID=UPI001F267A6A|nr:DUF6612 family protein [Sutcliffiella horikoshii]MCG1020886.1 hypothetical protein [Sutcliffiella horikoshii]
MKNSLSFLTLILFLLLLSGCNNELVEETTAEAETVNEVLTVEKVIDEYMAAHENVTNLEVTFLETVQTPEEYTTEGTMQIDLENDKTYMENIKSVGINLMYREKESVVVSDGEFTQESMGQELQQLLMIINLEQEMHTNSISFYQKYDPDFAEKLSLQEENDDHYVLIYDAEPEQKEELITNVMVDYYFEDDGSSIFPGITPDQLNGNDFAFTVYIAKDTFLTAEVEETISYAFSNAGENLEWEATSNYSYVFNEIDQIQTLEQNNTNTAFEEENEEVSSLENNNTYESDPEKELHTLEAQLYVDALIQATVFQDVEAFVNLHPYSTDMELVREKGENHRQMFKDIFISDFMRGFNENSISHFISDEQANEFMEAFLSALSQTRYYTEGATYDSTNDIFLVSVSIEGFSIEKLITEVLLPIAYRFENGELSESQAMEMYITNLTMRLQEPIVLEPPATAEVPVIRNGESHYEVLMQDSYLSHFVNWTEQEVDTW